MGDDLVEDIHWYYPWNLTIEQYIACVFCRWRGKGDNL